MLNGKLRKKSRQSGFTLLEIMLVMVLLAVMVSSVSLSFDVRSPYDKVKDEARRFQAAFQLAADFALLNSFQLGLQVNEDSYQFLVFDGERWQTLEQDKSLTEHKVEQNITLSLSMQEIDWISDAQQEGGIFSTADDNEEQAEKEKLIPQIYLFSSGEYIPSEFTLTLDWQDEVGYSDPLQFEVTAAGGFPLKLSDEIGGDDE